MNEFEKRIAADQDGLHSLEIHTFQVNMGLRCNQRCQHCHVEAAPHRAEMAGLGQACRVGGYGRGRHLARHLREERAETGHDGRGDHNITHEPR